MMLIPKNEYISSTPEGRGILLFSLRKSQ